MPLERGIIVRSMAGRDKNSFMVIVSVTGGQIYVCDGKERPLERPKLKNAKHIEATKSRLDEEQLKTNKQIRHALNDYSVRTQSKGEI